MPLSPIPIQGAEAAMNFIKLGAGGRTKKGLPGG
jgi:hypothetical protein